MNRLITKDDLIDFFFKGKQRGWDFIFSKLNISNKSRTKSAFNQSSNKSSNWWIIPQVKKRWNFMISGNSEINYKQYLMTEIISKDLNLKVLSLGSGISSHEIELASYINFQKITCVDLSEYRMSTATAIAKQNNLTNIEFICADIDNYNFRNDYYDIVLFNSSLHHFKDVNKLLTGKIFNCLKDSGKLIINEFVGATRLQFPKNQIQAVNQAIKLIPKKYRTRYNSSSLKRKFSGSGILRMIIADPSECIDSQNILPSIHNNYDTIIEKFYGGNILMNALKDISHHFVILDDEKRKVLDSLFAFEDEYINNNQSDFVFGIYKKTIANNVYKK